MMVGKYVATITRMLYRITALIDWMNSFPSSISKHSKTSFSSIGGIYFSQFPSHLIPGLQKLGPSLHPRLLDFSGSELENLSFRYTSEVSETQSYILLLFPTYLLR